MSSSTSSVVCQKNIYGEIVVPRIATSVVRYPAVSDMCGTKVPRMTCHQSGLAKKAAPTYARSASASHLKTEDITLYDPQTCNARSTAAIGTINSTILMGNSRLMEAAIAPISAPALMLLATTNAR